MTFKTFLTAAVASISGVAAAHDTAFPHVHPHGADVAIMALGIAALVWGGYKAGLFSAIRNRRDQ